MNTPDPNDTHRHQYTTAQGAERRKQKFMAWLDRDGQHGVTHNPKMVDSRCRAQVPRCLPSNIPDIPEVCSGDLDDPDLNGLDITIGAQQGGVYSLLHSREPMAEGSPYARFVGEGVFPSLKGEDSLFDRFKRKDPDLLACVPQELGPPEAVADAIVSAQDAETSPVACRFLKQVYFSTGEGTFHLLGIAPSSLLANQVHDLMRTWKVYDKDGNYKGTTTTALNGVRVNYGGSKPQNVGRLAVKYGSTALLSSCPPHREPTLIPYGQKSFWAKWSKEPRVRALLQQLTAFLLSDPPPNVATRTRRDGLCEEIVELLLSYREGVRANPNWTASPSCILPPHQKSWLDPQYKCDLSASEVESLICTEFAHVMDQNLPDLSHGQSERRYWQRLLEQTLGGFR